MDMMPVTAASEAYAPDEIARRVEELGAAKARRPWPANAMLGVLGGAFIALGCLWFTLVASDATLSVAAARVLGGFVFSLGLVLVVVAGAELFTGNNLLAMAWAAVRIAAAKASLPFATAFFAGILCNVLVCLAVWLAMAGRSVADKIAGIVLPVAAFVGAGFEHSVANMYFLPLGIYLRDRVDTTGIKGIENLDWAACLENLVPVTLGNIVGGSGFVALVYFVIYRLVPRMAEARRAKP